MVASQHISLPIIASEPEDRGPNFDGALLRHGLGVIRRQATTTLQINLGRKCNQACHHCHVEAGPQRTEVMAEPVIDRVLALLGDNHTVSVVDITGGAPELNPNFRYLVRRLRELGRHVIDRCNLTVLLEPGNEDLAEFLATYRVEVIASLPCYSAQNVDRQRGRGVFEKSIVGLQRLSALGYGEAGSELELNLVYNPGGAFLPPPQAQLEQEYKQRLLSDFGITFNRLYTLTNMPIRRFADHLIRSGQYDTYMDLLCNHFNPATVESIMCKKLLSVSWDGRLHDCDFNQMLGMPLGGGKKATVRTIWDLDSIDQLETSRIATGSHCFGCTAGGGSSCGGALE